MIEGVNFANQRTAAALALLDAELDAEVSPQEPPRGAFAGATQATLFQRVDAVSEGRPDPQAYDAYFRSEVPTDRELRQVAKATMVRSIEDFRQLAASMVAAGEVAPISAQTFWYAAGTLAAIVETLAIPAPLLLPMQSGAFSAEWHDCGLNIELRFRGPYNAFAVIEDVQGEIATLRGPDPNLAAAVQALKVFSRRLRA